MLSNHSFNALLKTLEEPPPHVKFLFATTDPQKLPVTILSRCLQFNLKNLSPKTIVEYLQSVLKEEGIDYDEEALWQIAAGAAGSMRDALTLVDQAISYCQGSVNKSGVVEMLGVPENQQVFQLLDAMASGDIPAVLALVNSLSDRVPDYAHTLDSLLGSLHRLAIAQVAPETIDNSFGDKDKVARLAQRFSAEDIQLFYQIGVKGRADLRSGVDVRSAFEMLLLRMMIFSPDIVDEDLKPALEVETNPEQAQADEGLKKKTEAELSPDASAIENAIESAIESTDVTEIAPRPASSDASPAPQPSQPGEQDVDEARDHAAESDNPAEGIEPKNLNHQSWLLTFPRMKLSGIVANVLANAVLEQVSENKMYFTLDETQSAVYNDDLLPKISQALSKFFNEELQVRIKIGAVSTETAAQRAGRLKQEFRDDLVKQFESDGNVQELVKRFSASVEKSSIMPVKNNG